MSITQSAKDTWNHIDPWNGLGHRLDPTSSVDTMLETADLDWSAIRSQLVAKVPPVDPEADDVEVKVSPEAYALIKSSDNSVLSVVGARYKVIQNSEAFEVFHEIADMGNLEIEAAGQMEGGKTVWALAKMVDTEHFLSDSEYIAGYFLFQQSFAQGSALKMMFMPMRFPSAASIIYHSTTGKNPVSFRLQHCKKLSWANKEKIKDVVTNARAEMKRVAEFASIMADTHMRDEDALYFLCQAMGQMPVFEAAKKAGVHTSLIDFAFDPVAGRTMSKVVQTLMADTEYTMPNHNAQSTSGSLWGYLLAVLYSIDHVLGHKHETRLYSAWFGLNNKTKLATYDMAKRQISL